MENNNSSRSFLKGFIIYFCFVFTLVTIAGTAVEKLFQTNFNGEFATTLVASAFVAMVLVLFGKRKAKLS